MSYKVIYDRENCIGANSCVGALPEFWSLDETKKAALKGSVFNPTNQRFELVIEDKDLEQFLESAQVCPVLVIDIVDLATQKSLVLPSGTGEVQKESAPVIKAKANLEDSAATDPKGYFTIRVQADIKTIKAHYYGAKHQLLFIIEGSSAKEIMATILRENFVTTLGHAAYLGQELQKAETALKSNLTYVQE